MVYYYLFDVTPYGFPEWQHPCPPISPNQRIQQSLSSSGGGIRAHLASRAEFTPLKLTTSWPGTTHCPRQAKRACVDTWLEGNSSQKRRAQCMQHTPQRLSEPRPSILCELFIIELLFWSRNYYWLLYKQRKTES